MQANLLRAFGLLALLVPALMSAKAQQVTVEDTGSTNRPGLRVTFDHEGRASVEPHTGQAQHVTLPEHLCRHFLRDLEANGPLNELSAVHCMKSASFGSSTFIEFKGKRSPDLSCPSAGDSRSEALRKDANDILQAARDAAGLHAGQIFTLPAPHSH